MLIAIEIESEIEKMNAMWISLKGNLKCGNKISDVATLPKKTANGTNTRTSTSIEKTKQDDEEGNSYNTNRFHELEIGEPSRNVVEMIFGASSAKTRRHSSEKIRRVLKVNNPADVVAKFENYREEVMMSSSTEHPRSIVDGNELLQFYGTTMSCCGGRNSSGVRVSQVCRDGGCRVCRVIQSGFKTYYNKIHGIRISRKSNRMSEDVSAAGKNAKKAVIICRMIGGGGGGGVGDDIDCMVVTDPTALLPCFVVIFD